MAADFNMNQPDYKQNKKAQIFVNIMFGHRMKAITNKPKRVIKKTVTPLDHIFTTLLPQPNHKTGII